VGTEQHTGLEGVTEAKIYNKSQLETFRRQSKTENECVYSLCPSSASCHSTQYIQKHQWDTDAFNIIQTKILVKWCTAE